jgi:TolB-like protein/tetratricopeptide (TPR) repeat protein
MFTDIVGYTSLTQKDEALSMQLLEEHRRLIRPFFPKHNGREVKTIGDAFLVEFASALEAVRCAFDIQQSMHEMNNGRLPEKQVQLRIGVHVGDVIHSQNDVYGDAVNVANRIEPLATPGGICVSEHVHGNIRNKFEFPLVSIGKKELKNVGEPMEVYKVVMPWEQAGAVEVPTFATNRIAILPFASLSLDPNDAFFADGVTDEIISAVAGISGLRVISRTSVIGYKGTTKKVKEIGKELEVGSILEGTFKKAGNRIRVTTQLIKVADDEHIWAQNYDRNLDDVFEVQSDVAKQVAEALRVKILASEKERIEKKPTESTSAYSLYLKGRHFWNLRYSGTPGEIIENLKSALKCFEQAVAEDPRFALGYVGQADCFLIFRSLWGGELEVNLKRAKEMVGKALDLDPELAEAHATNALVLDGEYRFKDEESEYRISIGLKPSYAMAHHWYYLLLLWELRWEEALKQIEKAIEFDPLSPVFNNGLAYFYFCRRDYGKALELFRRATELGVPEHGWVGHIYGRVKMFDDMKREFAAWVELQQGSLPFARAWADFYTAYYENDRQTCRRLLPELEAHFGKEMGLDAYDVALAYFCVGENDKGFEWLERSYSRKEGSLGWIKLRPELDGVRTDLRYLDLLKRLGLD